MTKIDLKDVSKSSLDAIALIAESSAIRRRELLKVLSNVLPLACDDGVHILVATPAGALRVLSQRSVGVAGQLLLQAKQWDPNPTAPLSDPNDFAAIVSYFVGSAWEVTLHDGTVELRSRRPN